MNEKKVKPKKVEKTVSIMGANLSKPPSAKKRKVDVPPSIQLNS